MTGSRRSLKISFFHENLLSSVRLILILNLFAHVECCLSILYMYLRQTVRVDVHVRALQICTRICGLMFVSALPPGFFYLATKHFASLLIQHHGMYLSLFHELCSFGPTQPRKRERQIENFPNFAYGSPTGRMDRHTLVPFLVLLATRFVVVDLFSYHTRWSRFGQLIICSRCRPTPSKSFL